MELSTEDTDILCSAFLAAICWEDGKGREAQKRKEPDRTCSVCFGSSKQPLIPNGCASCHAPDVCSLCSRFAKCKNELGQMRDALICLRCIRDRIVSRATFKARSKKALVEAAQAELKEFDEYYPDIENGVLYEHAPDVSA